MPAIVSHKRKLGLKSQQSTETQDNIYWWKKLVHFQPETLEETANYLVFIRNINFASRQKAHIFFYFFLPGGVISKSLTQAEHWLRTSEAAFIHFSSPWTSLCSCNFIMIEVLTKQQNKMTNRIYTQNSSCARKTHSTTHLSFQISLFKK